MSQLLSNFGVDWKLLLAQVVNFAILFYVLKRFAYGPLLDMLSRRRDIIKKGLEDADASGQELQNVTREAASMRTEAKKEAHALLVTAHGEAQDIVEAAKQAAAIKKEEILHSAQKDIEDIRKRNEYQLRQKSAEHIIAGVKAILKEEVTSDINRRLISRLTAK